MKFYDNLISLCAIKGVTPSGVAREIGLSNAAASGWKSGKKPSDVTLEKLSQYFKVPVVALTGENGQKNTAPTNGDGLTNEQLRAIEKIKAMPPEELAKKMPALEAVLDM